MADDSSEDKDLPPSERKLQKAKDEGSVLRAPDLFFLITLMGTFLSMPLIKNDEWNQWIQWWNWSQFWSLKKGLNLELMGSLMLQNIGLVLACCALGGGLSALVAWALSGFLWNPGLIGLKLSRINPMQKLSQMVSHLGSSVGWPLIKGLVGLGMVGIGMYFFVNELSEGMRDPFNALLKGLLPTAIYFLVVSGSDFLIQWRKRMHDLGMTLQEVKDEMKETDGNPEIKSRQRSIARQRAQSRMMQAVSTADVVVVNPEHFLVALKWMPGKHQAPMVVAKGLDHLALALKAEAKKSEVPVLEAPPFARALWAATKLDKPIPMNYFEPVAALLAWAYAIKERKQVRDPVLEIPND